MAEIADSALTTSAIVCHNLKAIDMIAGISPRPSRILHMRLSIILGPRHREPVKLRRESFLSCKPFIHGRTVFPAIDERRKHRSVPHDVTGDAHNL